MNVIGLLVIGFTSADSIDAAVFLVAIMSQAVSVCGQYLSL